MIENNRVETAVIKMMEALKLKSELDDKIQDLKSYITLDMLEDGWGIDCDIKWLGLNGIVIEKCKHVDYSASVGDIKISLHGNPKNQIVKRVANEYQKEVRQKVRI